MPNSTWINGITNDYSAINGIIQDKNYLLTEAYTRIITPVGSYIADPSFGSKIPIWINSRIFLTADKVTTEMYRALQVMVTQQRAKTIDIRVPGLRLNSVFFIVNITDNSNQTFVLDSNYIAA